MREKITNYKMFSRNHNRAEYKSVCSWELKCYSQRFGFEMNWPLTDKYTY